MHRRALLGFLSGCKLLMCLWFMCACISYHYYVFAFCNFLIIISSIIILLLIIIINKCDCIYVWLLCYFLVGFVDLFACLRMLCMRTLSVLDCLSVLFVCVLSRLGGPDPVLEATASLYMIQSRDASRVHQTGHIRQAKGGP